MRQVAREVNRDSAGKQTPALYGLLLEDFDLVAGNEPAPAAPVNSTASSRSDVAQEAWAKHARLITSARAASIIRFDRHVAGTGWPTIPFHRSRRHRSKLHFKLRFGQRIFMDIGSMGQPG